MTTIYNPTLCAEMVAERFWSKVHKSDGCWNWTGGTHGRGYGCLRGVPGRPHAQLLAHRVSWEIVNGPIPDGMTIDHLCLNKRCVNPAHLEVVSRGENARRWSLAKTHCKNGHPYSDDNTSYVQGKRRCLTCLRHNNRIHEARCSVSNAPLESELSPAQYSEICAAFLTDATNRDLGRRFGIRSQHVAVIRRGWLARSAVSGGGS